MDVGKPIRRECYECPVCGELSIESDWINPDPDENEHDLMCPKCGHLYEDSR